MPGVEARLQELGLTLPATGAIEVPFAWVRAFGDRVLVSGHGPLAPEGTPAPPFGRVPDQVSLEQAQQSARLVALAIMASVRDAVGDLDRIDAWLTVTGFVQAAPNYERTTLVMNGLTEMAHPLEVAHFAAASPRPSFAHLDTTERWVCSQLSDPVASRLRESDRQRFVYAASASIPMPRWSKRVCMPMRRVS